MGVEKRLIGRDLELTQLLDLVEAGEDRLITLTGIGGIGKTRLVAEVARLAHGTGLDAVYELELASLNDPDAIAYALGDALGIQGGARVPAVVEAIADRAVVVVLDNCEHLVDEVAALSNRLLRGCPRLRILTTSRVVLGVPGETLFAVPPLSLIAQVAGEPSPAVCLFIERARATGSDLGGSESAHSVQEIVCALDGIPLAIELAAARVRVLSPREIADGLSDHLALLAAGPRNGLARHQTMRASLDLSAGLLEADDRALFAELSVFVGSFSFAGACAVSERASLDAITRLVEHSLLAVVPGEDAAVETRYRFPEFVRQYAAELLDAGQLAALQAHHRAYYVALAKRASDELWAFSPKARRLLEVESTNLRRAIEHASKDGSEDTLWMASWLEPFWRKSGHFATGVSAAEAALAALPETATPARAIAMSTFSVMLLWGGSVDRAVSFARQALALAEQTGDTPALALSLTCAGSLVSLADPIEAAELAKRGLGLARQAGHRLCQSDAMVVLCLCGYFQWDREALEHRLPEALTLAQTLDHSTNLRWVWFVMAFNALQSGSPTKAHTYALKAVEVAGGDDPYSRAVAEATLAIVEAHIGQADAGRRRASTYLAVVERQQAGLGREALLNAIQICEMAAGDVDAARQSAVALNGECAAVIHRCWALETLTRIALHDGDSGLARRYATEMADVAQHTHNRRNQAVAQQVMAAAALLEGDITSAERLAKDALSQLVHSGWDLALIDGVELLAAVAAAQNDVERAARYLGAVSNVRAERGIIRVTPDADHWQKVEDRARQAARSEETFAAALTAGRELSLSEVCDYALRNRGKRSRPRHGPASLTPVERRIAQLACDGLTNPEIALRVFVSRSTVKMHLSQVYAKLGVNGRVALVAALRDTDDARDTDYSASAAPS